MTTLCIWSDLIANICCRCTRSCFQCPICIAPLSISSIGAPPSGLGADLHASQTGPYILNCNYCNWSSRKIEITFEKPNGIYSQLSKIKNGGQPLTQPRDRRKDRRKEFSSPLAGGDDLEGEDIVMEEDKDEKLDVESQFSNLRSFYQGQMADSTPVSALGFGADYGYSSPGALSRIMGLYTGSSFSTTKNARKNIVMREALDATEGIQVFDPSSEKEIAENLRNKGWEGTATSAQSKEQLPLPQPVSFVEELRPIPTLLRTKRSKRCKTCRHILSKPEAKVQTTRFKIRLVAHSYLPTITITSLSPSVPLPISTSEATAANDFLKPHKPVQFLLHFRNPLFESVKISLATPSRTPGRFPSEVAILCPSFQVGANTDAWDEALAKDGVGSGVREKERRRTKEEKFSGQDRVAEAGKVWERGRNWVSVVVEVVPASLKTLPFDFTKGLGTGKEYQQEKVELVEDEDILEIPVFVRMEWESEATGDEAGNVLAGGKEREKRELAYWSVLGLGRIAVN